MNQTNDGTVQRSTEPVKDLELPSAQAEKIEAGANLPKVGAYSIVIDRRPEMALDDLKPTADVNGGYSPKATDVTLKRGVID